MCVCLFHLGASREMGFLSLIYVHKRATERKHLMSISCDMDLLEEEKVNISAGVGRGRGG